MTEQHADLYRLVKWQPKPMVTTAGELKPGERFRCTNTKYGVWVRCGDDKCVCVELEPWYPTPPWTVHDIRKDMEVTVLSPCPDSTPSWADIIDGAPAGSVAWFEDRDGTPHLCKIPAFPRPAQPHNRFIGWLVPA